MKKTEILDEIDMVLTKFDKEQAAKGHDDQMFDLDNGVITEAPFYATYDLSNGCGRDCFLESLDSFTQMDLKITLDSLFKKLAGIERGF